MEDMEWIVEAVKRRRLTRVGNVDLIEVRPGFAVCIPRTTPETEIAVMARKQLKTMGIYA